MSALEPAQKTGIFCRISDAKKTIRFSFYFFFSRIISLYSLIYNQKRE